MKLLNVISYGIGGVLCASLLVACADGRGTNGFRAYQYSKDERAKNLALKEAQNPKPKQDANTPGADDSQKTGDVGTGNSAPILPSAPKDRPDAPPLFTETAKPQVLNEPGKPPVAPKPNPSEVTPMTAKVKDLNVTIEGELSAKMNETAKGLVKGITVVPQGPEDKRTITVQANVIINKEEVYLEATDVPVKFLKDEDSVDNIFFQLMKPCETEKKTIAVKNLLQMTAKCTDEKCNQIVVLLSFETENPNRRANAVVVVSLLSKGWAFTETNIGEPKTFEQSQKACPAAPAKPSTEPAVPAAPSVTAPAEGGVAIGTSAPAPAAPTAEQEKEKKEREAADSAWCEEVKKEGFSCDDSPGEIARMRNNRKAQALAEKERQDRAAEQNQLDVTPGATPAAPAVTMPAPAAEADQDPANAMPATPAPHDMGTDADTDADRADGR